MTDNKETTCTTLENTKKEKTYIMPQNKDIFCKALFFML